ncbi:hypothetical protein [Okeania sp. SIO2B9]|nr:hypothetical protein [Okeania sp. SIO2B9]
MQSAPHLKTQVVVSLVLINLYVGAGFADSRKAPAPANTKLKH